MANQIENVRKNIQEILNGCQTQLGIHFRNQRLLFQALTHSSFAPTHNDSNERLEFLGDSVLGLVITAHLYDSKPEASEGELSKTRGIIVSRKSCCQIAQKLQLDKFLLLSPDIHSIPKSILANLLEAVIGAFYLDQGIEATTSFILRIFNDQLEQETIPLKSMNFKAELQEKLAHISRESPKYIQLDEKGPAHQKCFKMAVRLGEEIFEGAWGNSKKEAEQSAARIALEQLEKNNLFENNGK